MDLVPALDEAFLATTAVFAFFVGELLEAEPELLASAKTFKISKRIKKITRTTVI